MLRLRFAESLKCEMNIGTVAVLQHLKPYFVKPFKSQWLNEKFQQQYATVLNAVEFILY